MIPPLGDRIFLLIDRETTESVLGVRCFFFCFPSLLVPQEPVAIPFNLLNKEQENQVIGRVEQSLISLSLLPEILLKVTWVRAQSCPEKIYFSSRFLSLLGQNLCATTTHNIPQIAPQKRKTQILTHKKRPLLCRVLELQSSS